MTGIAVTEEDSVAAADDALSGYRAHLDGLRTVAVYLVVAFHAGADRVAGGFIGVDVFFVLSGFLVTRVLLTARSAGTLTLRGFYARRVRRLLPAAVVVALAAAVMFSLVASPAELKSTAGSLRAALLYFENWHLIGESSNYFAADVDSNPVLHYWSLSIEEQFYLLWPLLLLGAMRITARLRRGTDLLRVAIAAVSLASVAWAFHLAESNTSRAYYGSDARAYQLLAGALLALSPVLFNRLRGVRLMSGVATGALLAVCLLGTSIIDVGPIGRGALTTVATMVLLLSLEARSGPARWFLSIEPMTYLGKISYGTYLWHWPVIIVLQRSLDLSPTTLFVIAGVVATGLAALSSQLLEMPIRTSARLNRIPRIIVVSGLAASVVAAVIVVPRLTDSVRGRVRVESAQVLPDDLLETGTDATSIDWETAEADKTPEQTCFNKSVDACRLRRGSGPHVLLIGDSHALMMRPALETLADEQDWTLSTAAKNGCSWPEIGYAHQPVEERERCTRFRADLYDRVIPELDPDVVVMGMLSPDDPKLIVAVVDEEGEPIRQGIAEVVEPAARDAIARLRADGRQVVLIEPVPGATEKEDQIKCLSGATVVEQCRFTASTGSTALEVVFREIAAGDDGVSTIDVDRIVCPEFPVCDAVIDGTVTHWNRSHITQTYAREIAPQIGAALEATGALEAG